MNITITAFDDAKVEVNVSTAATPNVEGAVAELGAAVSTNTDAIAELGVAVSDLANC